LVVFGEPALLFNRHTFRVEFLDLLEYDGIIFYETKGFFDF